MWWWRAGEAPRALWLLGWGPALRKEEACRVDGHLPHCACGIFNLKERFPWPSCEEVLLGSLKGELDIAVIEGLSLVFSWEGDSWLSHADRDKGLGRHSSENHLRQPGSGRPSRTLSTDGMT